MFSAYIVVNRISFSNKNVNHELRKYAPNIRDLYIYGNNKK